MQERLGLSEGPLGIALLGGMLGVLLGAPSAGWLVTRLGSRPVVGTSALLVSLVLLPLALASNLPLLVATLLLAGVSAGTLDASMNSQAVAVEKGYGRPIMSSFHAAFSLGGLAGAASGGFVASPGISVLPHFSLVAALSLIATIVAYQALLPTNAAEGGTTFARPTRALTGLGIISFGVLLGEGAMADWSAIYLRGTLETGSGFAAGYAAF
ncbi:MAG: MFS transporter [Actinomycetota bacterium]|nr:MFS transporter [Actinomycetota bacterium]